MEILFTEVVAETVSGIHVMPVLLGILSLGAAMIILVNTDGEKVGYAFFSIFVGVAVLLFTLSVNIPKEKVEVVYHEVILVDNEIIDATKYEVVERKGEIFRIKEIQWGE